jgi:hypothetical protein
MHYCCSTLHLSTNHSHYHIKLFLFLKYNRKKESNSHSFCLMDKLKMKCTYIQSWDTFWLSYPQETTMHKWYSCNPISYPTPFYSIKKINCYSFANRKNTRFRLREAAEGMWPDLHFFTSKTSKYFCRRGKGVKTFRYTKLFLLNTRYECPGTVTRQKLFTCFWSHHGYDRIILVQMVNWFLFLKYM